MIFIILFHALEKLEILKLESCKVVSCYHFPQNIFHMSLYAHAAIKGNINDGPYSFTAVKS